MIYAPTLEEIEERRNRVRHRGERAPHLAQGVRKLSSTGARLGHNRKSLWPELRRRNNQRQHALLSSDTRTDGERNVSEAHNRCRVCHRPGRGWLGATTHDDSRRDSAVFSPDRDTIECNHRNKLLQAERLRSI